MIRILMGINIIKNGIFPFFLDCSSTCISWLYWQLQCLSRSRAKNIWRSSAILHSSQPKSFPARPVRPSSVLKTTQKMADFREFGSLTHAAKQDPGNLKQDPSSTINGGLPGVWEFDDWSFPAPSAPGRSYPQVIPATFCRREFGSLSLILLWSKYIFYLLPESSLEFLGL